MSPLTCNQDSVISVCTPDLYFPHRLTFQLTFTIRIVFLFNLHHLTSLLSPPPESPPITVPSLSYHPLSRILRPVILFGGAGTKATRFSGGGGGGGLTLTLADAQVFCSPGDPGLKSHSHKASEF
ncbi:hypothetical protein E2C01_064502 [Portunus trituberculatus]|uniref:Uncharacterized protein n=1 Tax=Portunus trituberculatus TaxID=210409 RepID=A0A5B7HD65_PORTR|nr:hypothetical protein [Portunus trituberculatus]